LAILRGYGVVNGLSALRGYMTHHHSSIIADIDVDAARTHTNHWFSSKISKSFVASLAMLMCPSPSESHSSYEANKCRFQNVILIGLLSFWANCFDSYLLTDEVCPHSDNCVYGHVCPKGPEWTFNAQDSCKFVGTGMHKDISTMTAHKY
jgi:hypothetical protein